jgi:acyl-CoA thioester hydrolase
MEAADERKARVAVQLRFSDFDMARHAHNAVHLQWFELARMEFLRRVVPPGHDWTRHGVILARNEVDHRLPVRLHDTVEAEAWCSAVGTKSFDLRYAVVKREGGRRIVCTEGRSVMVCYDYAADSPMAIPADWRAKLEALRI